MFASSFVYIPPFPLLPKRRAMWFGRRRQRGATRQVAVRPCPNCGEPVPANRRACGACGASESDGWSDDHSHYAGDEGEDFDYDDYIASEFGGHSAPWRFSPLRAIAWTLLVVFAAGLLLPLLF